MPPKFKIVQQSSREASVDLIVLTCNGIKITEEFLRLFNNNTDQDLVNLTILDNASTDGTIKFLIEQSKDKENISLVLSSVNLGIINGRNKGFDFVNYCNKKNDHVSDYVMFLDNDQFVQNGWLESHMNCMEDGYDMIGVEAWQMNGRFIPMLKIGNSKQHYTYVGCGGMLIKRAVTDKIGMFDEQFNPSYFEDPDFCWRAYREGFKIGWNPKSKIVHMPHQTLGKLSREEKTKRFTTSLMKFREKWKGFSPPKMVLK